MSVSCDDTTYDPMEEDPYTEKFGDFEPSKCSCCDCCRYRTKYNLEGEQETVSEDT